MKKFYKILIFGLTLSLVLIIIGLSLGGTASGIHNVIKQDKYYTKQENIEFDNSINKLIIQTDSRRIKVIKSEFNYIEYYRDENKETVILENNKDNNKQLKFVLKTNFLKFPWINYGYVSPEINTVNIHLNDIDKYDLEIKNLSSGVIIEDIELKNLNIKVSSGSTIISKVNVLENIVIDVDSGRTTLTDINSESINIKSSSGRIRLSESNVDKINIKNNSGSVSLNYNISNDININVSSGSVKVLENRSREDMAFIARASSGYVKIFGKKVYNIDESSNNKTIIYTLKVNSGNIIIDK